MARSEGMLPDWTFDMLAWSARTLGGIGPLLRTLANRMEGRLRSRADRPAAELRHPPAVEQDKATMSLTLLRLAERLLAERRVGRPALRALLKTLFTDVLVHRDDEVLSDEVIETFFERIGAAYAFVFHYMPIGRAFTLDRMMTAEQRFRLYERTWSLVRDRHLFIVDFWNGATGSNGCVAAGRPGGYFHVNWNGDVSPCVFFPYSPVNLGEVYARGGTLDEVWSQPFFADFRKWQREYGYREAREACPDCRNWLAPCPIRDHHADFMRLMRAHDARPTDEDAQAALLDPAYHAGLERIGREFRAITDPVWDARYRSGSKGVPPGPMRRL